MSVLSYVKEGIICIYSIYTEEESRIKVKEWQA